MSTPVNPDVDFSQTDTLATASGNTLATSYTIVRKGNDGSFVNGLGQTVHTFRWFDEFFYWVDKDTLKRSCFTDEYYVRKALAGRNPVAVWTTYGKGKTNTSKRLEIEHAGRVMAHSFTEPSSISSTTSSWNLLGKQHRRNGPSSEQGSTKTYHNWGRPIKTLVFDTECDGIANQALCAAGVAAYKEGTLRYRIAGPDLLIWERKDPSNGAWHLDCPSELHQSAAVESPKGYEYYEMGKYHNNNGPATALNDGSADYYWKGEKLPIYEWSIKSGQRSVAETKVASDGLEIRRLATVANSGSVIWINSMGLLHNPDGPATGNEHYINGIAVSEKEHNECKEYHLEVRLVNKVKTWFKRGTSVIHRKYGPAVGTKYFLDNVEIPPEMFDAAVRQDLRVDYYYQGGDPAAAASFKMLYDPITGLCHSWEGPARVAGNGQAGYFVHGVRVDYETFTGLQKTRKAGIEPKRVFEGLEYKLRFEDGFGKAHRDDGPAIISGLKHDNTSDKVWADNGMAFKTEADWKAHKDGVKAETKKSIYAPNRWGKAVDATVDDYIKIMGELGKEMAKDKNSYSISATVKSAEPTVNAFPANPVDLLYGYTPSPSGAFAVETKVSDFGFFPATQAVAPILQDPNIFKRAKASDKKASKPKAAPLTKDCYPGQIISAHITGNSSDESSYWTIKLDKDILARIYGNDVYEGVWNKDVDQNSNKAMSFGEYFCSADYGNRITALIREEGLNAALDELDSDDGMDEVAEGIYSIENDVSHKVVAQGRRHNYYADLSQEIIKVEPIKLEMAKAAPPVAEQAPTKSSEMGLGGLLGMAIAGGALAGLIDWKAKKRMYKAVKAQPAQQEIRVLVPQPEPALAR